MPGLGQGGASAGAREGGTVEEIWRGSDHAAPVSSPWQKGKGILARAVDALLPERCPGCGSVVTSAQALCAGCWSETRFLDPALGCSRCAAPVPAMGDAEAALCEDCHASPRPWARGHAVAAYEGAARRMVLALKSRDRLDLAVTMGAWMARAGAPVLAEGPLLAPVPLHWSRLLRRTFNQSAVLARKIQRATNARLLPDLLVRRRATRLQAGLDRAARAENVRAAFAVAPRYLQSLAGETVVLVDDVMTTGATLEACTLALLDAGAARVEVLVFARVAPAA